MGGLFVFSVLLLIICLWLWPIVMIARSPRVEGGEKVAWILLVLFVSWFAWIFYLLLAPLKRADA